MTITIIDGDQQFVCEDVANMEGFESPQRIVNVADVAKKSGAAYLGGKFGRRVLSWQCLINVDTQEERRNLIALTVPGSLKTIRFSTCDGLNLETYVDITNIVMPYKIGRCIALIEAVSPYAQLMSQVVKEYDTSQTVVFGGGSIPAEVPMSLFSVSGGEFSITNDGNMPVTPSFRIDGPGDSFIIGNGDEQFQIDYIIGEGEYILIQRSDDLGLEVLLNGETPIYSSFSGTYWQVQPGENVLYFIPVNADDTTLLTITYQDGYIGI